MNPLKSTVSKPALAAEIRACLSLAAPLAGAQLAQAGTTFFDTVMMGLLGSPILAAGGLGAAVFQSLVLVSTGVISAVSPLVATAFGANQPAVAGKVVRQGWWLVVGLAVPIGLLVWFANVWLMQLGQDGATVNLARPYLHSIVWGVLPALGFAWLRSFVTALSQPRPVIVIMIAGTLFNVGANYVLMFGKLGLPALGLAGIGWASTISLWGMFLALLLHIRFQPRYRAYQLFRGLPHLDRRIFFDLMQIGIPIGVLSAVETGMFTITTFLMGRVGHGHASSSSGSTTNGSDYLHGAAGDFVGNDSAGRTADRATGYTGCATGGSGRHRHGGAIYEPDGAAVLAVS